MLIKGMNENPLSSGWKKRFSEQPVEVQEKLKALDNMNPKDYQFKIIKKSKNQPKEGDIFLFSPSDGIYFYGRVLRENINHIKQDTFVHGKSVVVLFKSKTKNLDMSNYLPNYDDLLYGPVIVDASFWSKGLFYTIGNSPISQSEQELDYGFYRIGEGKYLRENGVEIDHIPSILGTYGIVTMNGLARNIKKELIIDTSLLES